MLQVFCALDADSLPGLEPSTHPSGNFALKP